MKKNTNYENRKAAFTLAETLITVVILGIVAAILVPNLIKNQVENANRTKVKKAMAAYEKAINYIIIENDIKSSQNIKDFGEEESCKYASEYFKKVQKGDTDCVFKTPDKVWWNISDLTNPIIILKDELKGKNLNELRALAKDFDNKSVFALIGRFDDVGSLRVDDNGFEQSQENNDDNKNYMTKLWSFINNTQPSPDAGEIIANEPEEPLTGFAKCNAEGATTCVITVNGVSTTYTKYTTGNDTNVYYTCEYSRESKTVNCELKTSTATAGDYWISDILDSPTETEAKSKETCDSSIYEECNNIGDYFEAAKRKCESQGAHLAKLAELSIAISNGKMTSSYFWASEDNYSSSSYAMYNSGTIFSNDKNNTYGQFICVGND